MAFEFNENTFLSYFSFFNKCGDSHTFPFFLVYKYIINNGSARETRHHRYYRKEKITVVWHVKRMPEQRLPKLIMEWIPIERKKKV